MRERCWPQSDFSQEAVAIKDGKLVAVGSADDMKAVTGDSTKVVDLGKLVLPIGENVYRILLR